jgi:hypothetical protein
MLSASWTRRTAQTCSSEESCYACSTPVCFPAASAQKQTCCHTLASRLDSLNESLRNWQTKVEWLETQNLRLNTSLKVGMAS